MSLGDELAKVQGAKKQQGTPAGWNPRVEYDESGGEGVTPAKTAGDTPPTHQEILAEFGLDPAEWSVTNLRRSKWQVYGGEWLEAYRATFAPKPPNSPELVQADIEQLLAGVQKWKRPAIRAVREQPSRALRGGGGPRGVFVYALSDFQLGKGEGGGTPATVERILGSLGNGLRQLEDLRRLGHQIDTVVLPTLGDLVEQCNGHYAMQTFQADLNMREQRRLGWQLVMRHVHEFSQVADVLLTGIAGNHGETRNGDGKAFTTFDDSDDLLLLDAVAEIVAAAAGYGNVQVQLPERDPLTHSFMGEGVIVGLAHGHQFTKGTGAAMKAYEWWKGQALGLNPVADANVLLTGHFHSLSVSVFAENRTHIQAPTQDGGSYWFTSATGLSAPTGALTLIVGEDHGPLGWDNLRVV